MPTPITLEEAGVILGGAAEPISREMVLQLGRAGHIPIYLRGKAARTLKESCEAFLDQLARGEATWPKRERRVKAASTPKKAVVIVSSSRSTASVSEGEPKPKKPLKRYTRNS